MADPIKPNDINSAVAALQDERGFTRAVIAYAQLHGWRVAHFRPGRTNVGWRTAISGDGKGFPDLVLVRGERLLFVELKANGGQLSNWQRAWAEAINRTESACVTWRPKDWPFIEEELKK